MSITLFLIIGLLAFLFVGLDEGGAGGGPGSATGGPGTGAAGGGAAPEVFPGQAAYEATLTPEDRLQGVLHDPAINEAYHNARHPLHAMAVKRVEAAFNATYGTEPVGDFAAEAGVTEADLLRGQEKLKELETENEGRKLLEKAKTGHFSDEDVEAAAAGGHVHVLAESVAAELRGIGRWTPELQKELDGVVALAKGQAKAGNKEVAQWAKDMVQYIRSTAKQGKELGAYR